MDEIKNQLIFLLGSFLSGIVVMLCYEAVNVVRGLFRPGIICKLVLDVLFFVISAFFVFHMIFLCNNGTIRSFFVVAFGSGAILYRKTFGTRLSGGIVRLIKGLYRTIHRPYVWICEKILKKVLKNQKKP